MNLWQLFRMVSAILVVALPTSVCLAAWDPVPTVDLGTVDPAVFTDEELHGVTLAYDYPFEYYLGHFSEVANSVYETGTYRGYISLPVWRSPSATYNARVMENILSLTYYYTNSRSWNSYYGTTPVRDRLEAACEYWMSIQHSDGWFAEYSAGSRSRPATAFATRYMGETLPLLVNGPAIDATIKANVIAADRKAIVYTLDSDAWYDGSNVHSNQYEAVFAGALAYLDLYDDTEMETKLNARFATAGDDFQSPAGYYYEAGGADWGYNLRTHLGNVRMIYSYARGTALADQLANSEEKFFAWLSYNAVPIPGKSTYVLNRALETRQQYPTVEPLDYSPGERVELARAFSLSVEELQSQLAQTRADMAAYWPAVDPLVSGTATYSPTAFLHLGHYRWYPTDVEKQAAIQALPYYGSERFIHQRADDGAASAVCTYVRRPSYYAAFNAGPSLRDQQRFGLGLLWNPTAGAFLQSKSGSTSWAWGTKAAGATYVYEKSSLFPAYTIDGTPVNPATGAHDLDDGELTITYDLGSLGTKTLTFAEESIQVDVTHSSYFYEHIPILMLMDTDVLQYDNHRVQLARGRVTMEILLDGALQVSVLDSPNYIDDYFLRALSIYGYGSLSYTIALVPSLPGDANHDGKVDADDAQALAANWGQGSATWEMGDFNGDEFAGPADAAIMAANWGYGTAESTAVPEPGLAAMLLSAAVLLLSRRGC